MTEIIEVREKDLPRIIEIENANFSPPWSEGSLLAETEIPDARFAAVRQDGEICGYCITHISGGEAELYKIAVDSRYRKKGLASLLMDDMLRFNEARNSERVFLEVRVGNAPAIALYEKFGFISAGIRKRYYVNPIEDAKIMVKALGGESI